LEDLKGSNDALVWNTFRDHFYPVIVNFSRSLGLSSTYAEDAAQEAMLTFLKAFRDGRYNREKGRLGSWVFGVARRVILNFRKRLPREYTVADNSTDTSFWDMIEDENTVKHTWETEWRRMVLERCLQQARREFDSKVFRAFELYALSEQSVTEIGRILGMSQNAIYIAKSRVLSRLRQLVLEFDELSEGAGL